MNLKKGLISLLFLAVCAFAYSNKILVKNLDDNGQGSLRWAYTQVVPGDTILIDVSGTIVLKETITIDNLSDVTLIGPSAKHCSIVASSSWVAGLSMFNIANSNGIRFEDVSFRNGFVGVRAIDVFNSSGNAGSPITINHCLFDAIDNTGMVGGAISTAGNNVEILNCSFVGNTAHRGGAIYVNSDGITNIVNCFFLNNVSNSEGGVIFFQGTGTNNLTHNTFYGNNSITDLGEIFFLDGNMSLNMLNNAGAGNGANDHVLESGSPSYASFGGNIFKTNYTFESIPWTSGLDMSATSVITGLRDIMLEDGFGMKYYPIQYANSNYIDAGSIIGGLPLGDIRSAPRNITGIGGLSTQIPDAGACEYTRHRVVDVSSSFVPGTLPYEMSTTIDPINYIEFDIPGAGPHVIEPNSQLTADYSIIIDGFSQPFSEVPAPEGPSTAGVKPAILQIEISNANSIASGIDVNGTNVYPSRIQGLRLIKFDNYGLRINSSTDVFGCEIGINEDLSTGANNFSGIFIVANNCRIGGIFHWNRNVLSGNGISGGVKANIYINNSVTNTIVAGNLIGLAQDGMSQINGANGSFGVFDQGTGTVIGIAHPFGGNVICDNATGIYAYDNNNMHIVNNKVGVVYNGSDFLSNSDFGIELTGTSGTGGITTYIGESGYWGKNIISANGQANIVIGEYSEVVIKNNHIGVDSSGSVIVSNNQLGIWLNSNNASSVYIGTSGGLQNGNIISGNTDGIRIDFCGSVQIVNNKIGLDRSGLNALPNTNDGINVLLNASPLTIGAPNDGNYISGNDNGSGIHLAGSGHLVLGNVIGLAVDGSTPLANHVGIDLENASSITIGGNCGGTYSGSVSNVISGNETHGILVRSGSDGNLIQGNLIGVNAVATNSVGNDINGVKIEDADNTLIGGPGIAYANVIGGHINTGGAGIFGEFAGTNTFIRSNFIGIRPGGSVDFPNETGIRITDTHEAYIGGDPSQENFICASTIAGVHAMSPNVVIDGNFIGLVPGATNNLQSNLDGVLIEGSFVTVGDTPNRFTVMANNTRYGVYIKGDNSDSNAVNYCHIGVDQLGNPSPNGEDGIKILDGDANFIGDISPNTIAANVQAGIKMEGSADNNEIVSNKIGNVSGNVALANDQGVVIVGGQGNLIGGISLGNGNVIKGNTNEGVFVQNGLDNEIFSNFIGTDAANNVIPNGVGVRIKNSTGTIVGGEDSNGNSTYNVISGNTGEGIIIDASNSTGIYGNRIGTNVTGNGPGSNLHGISIVSGSTNTDIGTSGNPLHGNTISMNSGIGIKIDNSTNTNIYLNKIGVSFDGVSGLGVQQTGISLENGATLNNVGGDHDVEGNRIAGNTQNGVRIFNATDNNVFGNEIGLVFNNAQLNGVVLEGNSSTSNVIGNYPMNIYGNIISQNQNSGIQITNGAGLNEIIANMIGLDSLNQIAPLTQGMGVEVRNTAGTSNFIGIDVPGGGNVISGNNIGVMVNGAVDHNIYNNKIGTDTLGLIGLGNLTDGVNITSGANNIVVGGSGANQPNLISGNLSSGVHIDGSNDNYVLGNGIGVNISGTAEIPNLVGVGVENGSHYNYVGDAGAGNGNIISGNDGAAVIISGSDSNYVKNNLIGTIFANKHGVILKNNAANNHVGGSPAEGNVICGNDSIGIGLFTATSNYISSNSIGIMADGVTPNGQIYGVYLSQSTGNEIGSSTTGEQNIISSNSYYGIGMENNSNGNLVFNNYLGTGASGNQVFGGSGNGVGIYLNSSSSNTIGGDLNANEGNVICFSSSNGIWLDGSTSNTIAGNNIGLSKNNDVYLGNAVDGIRIENFSGGNSIGLAGNGYQNVIVDNMNGIHVKASANNIIQNNFIGNDELGGIGNVTSGTNNSINGIVLDTLSVGNQIIGQNVISGNSSVGIGLLGPGTKNNLIQQNYIGVAVTGSTAYSNDSIDIYIGPKASGNQIGGTTSEGNIIGGNCVVYVYIEGAHTDSNQVAGNYIGIGEDQITSYTTSYGIFVDDSASYNLLGGGLPDQGNYIAVLDSHAIYLGEKTSNSMVQGNTIGLFPGGANGAIGGCGILMNGSDWNQIGGLLLNSDSANVITNCYKGVGLTLIPFLNSSYGNAIIGNSIYNNQQLGIDIDSDDLVEPIDTNQTIGNNGDIDFPLILTAWNCGVNNFTHVGFEFYSNNAFPGYRVEFYSNSVSDGSGHGEGEVYLGDWVFDPDTNVDTISIDLGQTLPVGTIITATITGTLLNTSEFSLNYLVTDPPVFDPPTTLEETCLGAANAEIYIDAPEAYYFSIDGFLTQTYGINGDTLIDLASGTYNVEAKYLNGCVLSQPVTLAPGPELPFAVTVVPDTCGLNVGYLLIDTVLTNAAGGTGDYIYTFDGSTFNGNIDMINVAAGNYDIGLMDTSLGCNSLITQYNVPEITDVVDESFSFDDFCLADTPIPYNIATSGGSWVFNPAVTDGATIDVNSGEIFNAVTGNSYTVEYTVGICNESSSAVVTAAPVEDGSFVYDPFCIGLTPSITVTESGGAWSFNPDPGTASIDPSTGEITGTGGTYMVQYVTGGTCPDTVVNAVITYDSPSAPITTITDSIYCPDDQIQAIQAPAGTSLSYSWYDDVALTMLLDTGDSFIPSLLAVGPNDFYVVMSDANGCNSEAGKVNYYLVDTSPMFASIDIDVCVGSEVELDAQGGIVYSWSVNSQITGDLNVSTTTAKILTPDNFIVKITDAFGCVVIDTVHIGLLSPDQCEVVVYNAYSPNNDGVNDFWEIDGIEGFPENTVVIYNRWGDVIIQFENYNNSDVIWGGENKSGGIVPAGTYYFVVEVGGEQDQAGWVQILR